jgi:quercetin dioxygenase-like cupin family protein
MTLRPAVGPVTPHLFRPDRHRPVRAKLLHLLAATRVVPHAHPWGQVAISSTGVVRVTMPHGTTIVPPSRALWIPPGVEHAVTVVEDADLLTLYVDPARRIQGLAARKEAAGLQGRMVLPASHSEIISRMRIMQSWFSRIPSWRTLRSPRMLMAPSKTD